MRPRPRPRTDRTRSPGVRGRVPRDTGPDRPPAERRAARSRRPPSPRRPSPGSSPPRRSGSWGGRPARPRALGAAGRATGTALDRCAPRRPRRRLDGPPSTRRRPAARRPPTRGHGTGPGRQGSDPTRGRWSTEESPAGVLRIDRRALCRGQIEQIDLRHARLRNPQRLSGTEHEPVDPDRAEQRLEVIFRGAPDPAHVPPRSEEHTSELQSQSNLVCRLLLEKKKTNKNRHRIYTRAKI